MADTKISALPAATAALGADELPINEAGTSKKLTVVQIAALIGTRGGRFNVMDYSAPETGTYADISGTGATPARFDTGTEAYIGYDPLGTSGTWYRTRFENAGATQLSDWSAAKPTTYP